MAPIEDILWQTVKDHPLEPLHKQVLADFYEERGDNPDAVRGLRLAAEKGYHPYNYDSNQWSWYDSSDRRQAKPDSDECNLPPELYAGLKLPKGREYLYQWTLMNAFERLGVAVEKLESKTPS